MTQQLDSLVTANEAFMQAFGDSKLLALLSDPIFDNEDTQLRLLDYLQWWSDEFQRVIITRAECESAEIHSDLARDHLVEEIGHNKVLADDRDSDRAVRWDPVIAAASAWFVGSMRTLDSAGRTALAHLVLEGSGLVFATTATKVLPGKFFELHDGADLVHLEMGIQALRTDRGWDGDELRAVIERGWTMITLLCDRLADVALGHDGP
jgi:hypothetical protein